MEPIDDGRPLTCRAQKKTWPPSGPDLSVVGLVAVFWREVGRRGRAACPMPICPACPLYKTSKMSIILALNCRFYIIIVHFTSYSKPFWTLVGAQSDSNHQNGAPQSAFILPPEGTPSRGFAVGLLLLQLLWLVSWTNSGAQKTVRRRCASLHRQQSMC